MIIIGDKLIPYEEIFFIKDIKEIENTKANSIIGFVYNENLLEYCFKNELSFVVIVNSIKEAIYSNSLKAKYIIAQKDLSKELQKIAENYMYDSKILAIIDSNNEFEEIAKNEIDGIIYKNLISL